VERLSELEAKLADAVAVDHVDRRLDSPRLESRIGDEEHFKPCALEGGDQLDRLKVLNESEALTRRPDRLDVVGVIDRSVLDLNDEHGAFADWDSQRLRSDGELENRLLCQRHRRHKESARQ